MYVVGREGGDGVRGMWWGERMMRKGRCKCPSFPLFFILFLIFWIMYGWGDYVVGTNEGDGERVCGGEEGG